MLYIKANFKNPDDHVSDFEKERDSYLHILDPTIFAEAKEFYGSPLNPKNPNWEQEYYKILNEMKQSYAAANADNEEE